MAGAMPNQGMHGIGHKSPHHAKASVEGGSGSHGGHKSFHHFDHGDGTHHTVAHHAGGIEHRDHDSLEGAMAHHAEAMGEGSGEPEYGAEPQGGGEGGDDGGLSY